MTDLLQDIRAPRGYDPTALIRAGVRALPLGDALKLLGNLGTFNGWWTPCRRDT